MTKQEIYDLFDGKIAKVAIKPMPNTEFHPLGVSGKYCELEYMGDGLWDLYLRNGDSPTSKLSGKRINQFPEKFSEAGCEIVKLDGEAWCQGKLENGLGKCILRELKWLGIRKSPELSPETIAARDKRIKDIRRG